MKFISKQNQNKLKSLLKFIKANSLIILIVISATWLRTWKIDTHGIFFGDAGRDLLAAKQAVESRSLPLLGIPSSIPRFHQGPLTIWLEIIIYLVFGQKTLAFSLSFAFLSILALIFIYEYAIVHINKKTALIATTLFAFSPLAIANSRVPYHTTPIPLVMIIFLFALIYLWRDQKYGVFVAGLAWALLVQFELSLFALGLMIPYVFYRQRKKISLPIISQISTAGLIGFLPQIIHDLTSPISESQLGGFFIWVGYRIISLTGVVGQHQLSLNKLAITLSSYWQYLHRIFGVENTCISVVFLSLLFFTGFTLIKKRKKLQPGIELVAITTLLLTISYFVHGSLSEAYFPPYFTLLSLLLGWGLNIIFKKHHFASKLLLTSWAITNIMAIFNYNFFVDNHKSFNYVSISEQRQIINYLNGLKPKKFQFETTQSACKFPSYFDNFRWLAQELGAPENQESGMVFYIESKNSSLASYPGITKVKFNTFDVYYR
ncbi:glycosyltransferase family 39 protein [Patescibacteria group bacterium]|nr:glycosyltransferase family 39 protein [Patescibacteria group bacterium]